MSLATREQKAVMTDFDGDGTFWFFSVMKKTYRKTWRKYKWTIKVENWYRIQWRAKAKSTVNFSWARKTPPSLRATSSLKSGGVGVRHWETGLSAVSLTVPYLLDYLCLRTLPRTMVMSKKNRHHQNHRQIPFCFWMKWPGLFDC